MTLLRLTPAFLAAVVLASLPGVPAAALDISFTDVNPDNSDTDPLDPDGATGGRINGIVVDPSNADVMYGASEWGGIYKSTDGGLEWSRLDGHLPVATWDVAVDPAQSTRLYATSFFDGRATSLAGISVSTDGGVTWSQPPSAVPPAGFCQLAADEDERSAFGIAIDPGDSANVFIGTSCGLAVTSDSGVTWTYRDPTGPAGSADRIWDVLAAGSGVVHVCGDDGHLRSDDGGVTWTAGSGLNSGRCSLAQSPDEDYVLFAVAGTSIFESDNATSGAPTWTQTRTNLTPQGRIPFVATNQRSDAGLDDVFDLWFGDVSLFRVGCTTPDPPAPGGSPRCGTGNTPPWAGPFTRTVGGHDDMGDILFDPTVAADGCPLLMSSDGGVYYNTDDTADCHNPNWEQPDVTPHGLWLFSMGGADQAGDTIEDLYFGNQDNGLFGTTDAGGSPTWHNALCCDGFDALGDPAGGLFTVCCAGGGGRSTLAFRTDRGFFNATQIDYPPTGLLATFRFTTSFVNYDGGSSYAMITRNCTPGVGGCPGADGGLYVTSNIDGNPITWTELGNATEPPSNLLCGIYGGVDGGGQPTFYAMAGSCNSTGTADRVFRFRGTNPGGAWTEIFLPQGGFGVFATDPTNPDLLLASGLTTGSAAMYRSDDGGDSWSPLPDLDDLMSGLGDFPVRNTRGPTNFTGFNGYWQPSLVGLDGGSSMMIAGGQDSGVFLSLDDGETWTLITDPYDSDTSGVPHLPRPRYAYFDGEPGGTRMVFVGTQGRGVWRIDTGVLFADGFESGNTSTWDQTAN